MTSTCLQLKRSERGEALVVTISIIGLAIIVTAAAFLLRAATGQDTERLASAKVDIATREDTLMRWILQQTAKGMLPSVSTPWIIPPNGLSGTYLTGPSLDWTTIMTNAVAPLAATAYVDPNEVATLGLGSVIPANMGDPDDGSTSDFLLYTSTATGVQDCNVLKIDLLQMYHTLGLNPAQCYSIYIGCDNPYQVKTNSPVPEWAIKRIKEA
jgi:hypothetical protein